MYFFLYISFGDIFLFNSNPDAETNWSYHYGMSLICCCTIYKKKNGSKESRCVHSSGITCVFPKIHSILCLHTILMRIGEAVQLALSLFYLFIYLGFYIAFNTVQVISRRVVGRAEETSTYSLLGFCTVNCRPTASNYQLSHLRPSQGSNPRPQRWEARINLVIYFVK